MAEIVGGLSKEKKKEFAKACVEVKDGKNTITRSKAKAWLVKECSDRIEWKNKPQGNRQQKSGADIIASWLDL